MYKTIVVFVCCLLDILFPVLSVSIIVPVWIVFQTSVIYRWTGWYCWNIHYNRSRGMISLKNVSFRQISRPSIARIDRRAAYIQYHIRYFGNFDITRFCHVASNLEIQYRWFRPWWKLKFACTLFGIASNKWTAWAIRNTYNTGLRRTTS